MLCNIKPVPFHESDKHIFAKIPGGGASPPPLDPPMQPILFYWTMSQWTANLVDVINKSYKFECRGFKFLLPATRFPPSPPHPHTHTS